MENGGSLFSIRSNSERGQNGNNGNNIARDIWELNTSRFDCNINSISNSHLYITTAATSSPAAEATTHPEARSTTTVLMFPRAHAPHQSLYAGNGSHIHPDPHLMCLKLGKRHYFEDAIASSTATPLVDRHVAVAGGFSIGKRGKPYYSVGGGGVGQSSTAAASVGSTKEAATATTTVPRCQVEGCRVVLVNAKEYHRRHKVCEMHSKAPKVVVLGLEQRFCQQCSRFHVVSEFDESKRSCRRRLAGHNERRRKSTHDSVARNSSQENKAVNGRIPYTFNGRIPYLSSSSSPTGRALSLLSSKFESWDSPSDLSARSSAALRELIAENRAAILARQLILGSRDWHSSSHSHHSTDHQDLGENQQQQLGSNSFMPNHHQEQHQNMLSEPHNWERYHEANNTHITLDLMEAPSAAFGFLSVRGKSREEEEECSLWNSFDGAHVV